MTIILGYETTQGTALASDSAIFDNAGFCPIAKVRDKIRVFPKLKLAMACSGSIEWVTKAEMILHDLEAGDSEDILDVVSHLLTNELMDHEAANRSDTGLLISYKGELYGLDIPGGDLYRPIMGTLAVSGSGSSHALGAWYGMGFGRDPEPEVDATKATNRLGACVENACAAAAPGCCPPVHAQFFFKT